MAASRALILGAGGIATATIAAILPWSSEKRTQSGLAVILIASISALIPELLALRLLIRDRREPPRPPRGARPPDGVVDVMTMAGVESVANEDDTRWRRFARVSSAGLAPVHRRPGGSPLLGRVALVSVFVGRDGRSWTDPEIARAYRALERAGEWLEREAGCWDAPVNVALPDVYFRVEDDAEDAVEVAFQKEGDDIGPMEKGAASKGVASASRVSATLGFADVVDLTSRIDSRIDADVLVWLFHVLRAGRSLAIPATDPDAPGVGLAICYAREASFPGPLTGTGRVDPVTVVHELLHLFGATDKYGIALGSFPHGSVGSRDVMRLDHESLSRLVVGSLTASEVGWHGRLDLGGRQRRTPAAIREGRGGQG